MEHKNYFDQKLFEEYFKKILTEKNSIKRKELIDSIKAWIIWLHRKETISTNLYEDLLKRIENIPSINSRLKPTANKLNLSRLYIFLFSLLFFLFIGILLLNFYLYSKVITLESTNKSLSEPAGRVLPFKGTIKQTDGAPLDTKRDMTFRLYTSAEAKDSIYIGSCLGENGIVPTYNGSFTILVGSDCGMKPIPEKYFKNNNALFLGITIGNEDELKPRYQIVTSTFSKDTNKLQGMTPGSTISSIPFINQEGKIELTNESPSLISTNGTFLIQGQNVTLKSTQENENISLDPALGGSVIINSGKLGIGTLSPQSILDVSGSNVIQTVASIHNLTKEDSPNSSVLKLGLGVSINGTNATFIDFYADELNNSGIKVGSIRLNNNGVAYETSGADFAEYFPVSDKTQFRDGQIVSLSKNGIRPSRIEEPIIGIVSNSAGFVGNTKEKSSHSILVGLVGQVEVLVSNKEGDIEIGDIIGPSEIPGYGQKNTDIKNKVGYALEKSANNYFNNTLCPSSFKNVKTENNELIKCGKLQVIINLD